MATYYLQVFIIFFGISSGAYNVTMAVSYLPAVIIFIGISTGVYNVSGSCVFPGVYQEGLRDSSRGLINVTDTQMYGWGFEPVPGTFLLAWDCVQFHLNLTTGSALIVLVTSDSFQLFGTTYYAYLCVSVYRRTVASYRYYINYPRQINLNDERLYVNRLNNVTDVGVLCDFENGATGQEYHVLINTGREVNATVECPRPLLGLYGYTYHPANGQSSCNVNTSELDMCTDGMAMSFDYDACPARVFQTDHVIVEGVYYVLVYSTDVDGPGGDFNFSCFAFSANGAAASVAPNYCRSDQTPEEIPLTIHGVQEGARLSMDRKKTCQCDVPDDPTNGTVSNSNDGTTITYSCDKGFTLDGDNVAHCLVETSAWSGDEPLCVTCDTILAWRGLSVSYATNGTLTTASFTCDVNQTLVGRDVLSCTTNGTWDGDIPTCVVCESMQEIDSGHVTFSTNGTVTIATHSCMKGYYEYGPRVRSCDHSGRWDDHILTCFCRHPAAIENGATIINGSTAVYQCSEGYTLSGPTIRQCLTKGRGWDGTVPTCDDLEEWGVFMSLPGVVLLSAVIVILVAVVVILVVKMFRDRRKRSLRRNGTFDHSKTYAATTTTTSIATTSSDDRQKNVDSTYMTPINTEDSYASIASGDRDPSFVFPDPPKSCETSADKFTPLHTENRVYFE